MKAVLVFCEGRHDVVFAQRSLSAHGGCEWVKEPIGGLPSPFGQNKVAKKGLIATQLEGRAVEDLTLQDAAHPARPCFEAVVINTATNTIFFLVRAQGKDQSDPTLGLLDNLYITISEQPAGTFDVAEYAAAFLFDANSEGVTSTLAKFRSRFAVHFGDLSELDHGKWLRETRVPVGCFVFQNDTKTRQVRLRPIWHHGQVCLAHQIRRCRAFCRRQAPR